MADGMRFTGNESLIIEPVITSISNSFTYEFWAKPTAMQALDAEEQHGMHGTTPGKRYAIGPGFAAHGAGVGVSVGVNGVAVYEHSHEYMPALLVCPAALHDWVHVAVVYYRQTPHLYLNGKYIKQGVPSSRQVVHPSAIIGGFAPYGFYEGELKHVRIWNDARSIEQVRQTMGVPLRGNEPGLYLCWNEGTAATEYQGVRREPDVSIVLPAYNKYPECLLTLHALEKQTYDPNKYEVIFVDDASTDATRKLPEMCRFPYLFNYIQLGHNITRPKVRNTGIRFARGKVIVFLDAEVLVEPDFVANHAAAHRRQDRLVVSGAMIQRGVYSVLYPGFARHQLDQAYGLLRGNARLESLWNHFTVTQTPVRLFEAEHIYSGEFKRLSFVKPHAAHYEKMIFARFGDRFQGYALPWMAFFTGNVSVRRDFLNAVGPFEEYEGYGWDDTEMGYRMHLNGASFLNCRKITSYHQEHPVSPTNAREAFVNYYAFQQKYRHFDVLAMTLLFVPKRSKDLFETHLVVNSYQKLCRDYPHSFRNFQHAMLTMMQVAGYKLANGMPVERLALEAGLHNQLGGPHVILAERDWLAGTGKFGPLIDAFDVLFEH